MSWSSTLIRPKSMATVVVVLPLTAVVSSIPIDRSVSVCSVVTGGISDTAPTNVVLPAPNPPAIRILRGMIRGPLGEPGPRTSTRAESIEQPFEDHEAGPAVVPGQLWEVQLQAPSGG